MSIRIGILGYGNLGRGVECAIRQNPDMELAAVFTRRAPEIVFVRSQRKLYLIYFKHTFSPLNRFCRALPCEQT